MRLSLRLEINLSRRPAPEPPAPEPDVDETPGDREVDMGATVEGGPLARDPELHADSRKIWDGGEPLEDRKPRRRGGARRTPDGSPVLPRALTDELGLPRAATDRASIKLLPQVPYGVKSFAPPEWSDRIGGRGAR